MAQVFYVTVYFKKSIFTRFYINHKAIRRILLSPTRGGMDDFYDTADIYN